MLTGAVANTAKLQGYSVRPCNRRLTDKCPCTLRHIRMGFIPFLCDFAEFAKITHTAKFYVSIRLFRQPLHLFQ